MTCEQIERDEVAEQYVSGRLSAADQADFETHYFDCTHCQERLRVLEDTRSELASGPDAAASGHLTSPTAAARRPSALVWRVASAGLAAAAVIVLAVRLMQVPEPQTAPDAGPSRSGDVTLRPPETTLAKPDLRALAQIQPPRFEPLRLRTNTTSAQREFRAAMDLYVAGDYDQAVAGLRRAIALDQSLLAANFYLAVCLLHGNQTAEGVTVLQRVIASGESPYLEDAHFFLAKGRIREGDIASARLELTRVMALEGDRRDEARRLLAQLPAPR